MGRGVGEGVFWKVVGDGKESGVEDWTVFEGLESHKTETGMARAVRIRMILRLNR